MNKQGRPKGRNYPKQICFPVSNEQYEETQVWKNKAEEIRKRVFDWQKLIQKLEIQIRNEQDLHKNTTKKLNQLKEIFEEGRVIDNGLTPKDLKFLEGL